MLGKLLLFFLWVILIPLLIGCYWSERHKKYPGSLFLAYFYGIFIEFALFEILAVPLTFLKASLRLLTVLWLILSLALAVCSVILGRGFPLIRKKITVFGKNMKASIRERVTPLLLVLLFCLILQVVFVTAFQHIDEDDAYFVATASTAVQTDTLLEYNPYTGELYHSLPARYVFAPWPLFLAVLTIITGIHPAVIAHLILPGLILLLAYLIYALIARELFPEKSYQRDLFLLAVVLILSFFGFSIYTSGTFLLTRGWQGKALVAGLIQPALFYICRSVMKDRGGWEMWGALFCVVTAACMFSSMGIVLGIIPVGVYALVYGISQKRWRCIPWAALSCLAAAACGVSYLLIR